MKMIFRDFLYISALSSIVSLGGCKSTLLDLQKPEIRQQWEGHYKGQMDGIPVIYTVKSDRCILEAHDGLLFLDILDLGCDNTVDYLNPYSIVIRKNRKDLIKNGDVETFDSLLERGQKLVRLENKVKEEKEKK